MSGGEAGQQQRGEGVKEGGDGAWSRGKWGQEEQTELEDGDSHHRWLKTMKWADYRMLEEEERGREGKRITTATTTTRQREKAGATGRRRIGNMDSCE